MYVCTLLWIGLCTVGLDGGPWRKTPDALCRSSHFPMLELMLLSIQLLSVQLSSTAAFNFVACGILWNAALNTEYSVVLLSIQRFAAFHPRCHSDHWRV